MPKRVLLRGGHVLSMDPPLGDLYGGDVLIEDDRIAAVGHELDAGDAEIDRRVRLHRHPGLHRLAPAHVGDGDPRHRARRQPRRLLRPRPRPARAGLPAARTSTPGNYLGSLEAIDAGVTTLLDWSHINNTPEHADEAIRGLARRAPARRLLLRQPEHVPRRLVVHERAEGARGHPPRPRPVLLERRRADDARDGHARPRLLHRRRSSGTTGSSPATSARRSASTSAWAPMQAASRWSAARTRWACSTPTRRTSTATTSPTTSSG